MVERRYPGFRVTGTLLEADESYLCVPWLEGVIKLRHQLADKERKVIVDLEKSVCSGVISLSEREVTVPSSTTTPPRISEAAAGSTSRDRQRRLSGRIIERQQSSSPLVVCVARTVF